MKKIFLSGLLILLSSFSLFGISSAVFEEKVSVLGTSFTIGENAGVPGGTTSNTALKILKSNSSAASGTNLVDSISGPAFGNVDPTWVQSLPIKVFNKGTQTLSLVAGATYVNDPDTLRDDLYIEILAWNDSNNDGNAQETEIGQSYGRDTILRFKNDTFALGDVNANAAKGFVLRFDGTGLSDANIGKTAVYDFVFTGVEKALQ